MSHKICAFCIVLLIPAVCLGSLAPNDADLFSPSGGAGLHFTPIGSSPAPGETLISGVPAYLWRHGCGPTAAGMVIGYWDMHGFSSLIPGNSSTQTAAVNQAIASDEHYADYALPLDDPSTGFLLDKSCEGEAHESNSIADFMMTSWASAGNYYGWSSYSNARMALLDYTRYVNATTGSSYVATSVNKNWGSSGLTWSLFTSEINQHRPMMFLVDSSGDGLTDHFVTAIGYRQTNGYGEYALLDTWSNTQIRWERFRALSAAYPWGIHGATLYTITPEPSTLLMLILVVLTSVRTRRLR